MHRFRLDVWLVLQELVADARKFWYNPVNSKILKSMIQKKNEKDKPATEFSGQAFITILA